MDNSRAAKISTLLRAFGREPQLIGPYLRRLPLWGCTPVSAELPWISFGALERLNRHVQSGHEVFEYGGGGSTLYFARRARSVLTVESDAGWHNTLVGAVQTRALKNVTCELHPITGDEEAEFRDDAFFQRIRAQSWDIVLIDCYCGYSRTRYGVTRPFALELAFGQLKSGGIIVLDDSWMFRELLGTRSGWRITDYVGPGPCRYGVTSTAILEKK